MFLIYFEEREARKRARRMSNTSDMSGPKRGHRLQVSDMSAASTKSSSRKNTAITCQDDIVSMKSYKSIQLGEQVQLSTKAQGTFLLMLLEKLTQI